MKVQSEGDQDWYHLEGFLLTYLGSRLGMFKKLDLLGHVFFTAVSLDDVSAWPLSLWPKK